MKYTSNAQKEEEEQLLLDVLIYLFFFFLAYFDLSCCQIIFIFSPSKQETKATLAKHNEVCIENKESILFLKKKHILVSHQIYCSRNVVNNYSRRKKISCIYIRKEETKVSILQIA